VIYNRLIVSFFVLLLLNIGLLGVPIFAVEPDGSSSKIPPWFKSNAIWWRSGSITDNDIINAIENLIEQDVIRIDFSKIDSDKINSELKTDAKIPSYVKDVFGFWSDDLVPDSDVVNSIEFLITKGIISSTKIQYLISISQKNQNDTYDQDSFKNAYKATEWNKFSFKILLELLDYQTNTLVGLSNELWEKYGDSHNMEDLENAKDFEILSRKAKDDSTKMEKILESINQNSEIIKKNSLESGIPILELESFVKEPGMKIEDIKKLRTMEDYKTATEEFKNAELEIAEGIKSFEIVNQQSNLDLKAINFEYIIPNEDELSEPLTITLIASKDFGSILIPKDEKEQPDGKIISPELGSFHHAIGQTSCPQKIPDVLLNAGQQGTWRIVINPPWVDANLTNVQDPTSALIHFNCKPDFLDTQSLSGIILFEFRNLNGDVVHEILFVISGDIT